MHLCQSARYLWQVGHEPIFLGCPCTRERDGMSRTAALHNLAAPHHICQVRKGYLKGPPDLTSSSSGVSAAGWRRVPGLSSGRCRARWRFPEACAPPLQLRCAAGMCGRLLPTLAVPPADSWSLLVPIRLWLSGEAFPRLLAGLEVHFSSSISPGVFLSLLLLWPPVSCVTPLPCWTPSGPCRGGPGAVLVTSLCAGAAMSDSV